jgi:N-ethylmaleimide reductase
LIYFSRETSSIQHTAFFVKKNFGADEGAQMLESGKTEAVVFGRLYISNPDLEKRLINKLELNTNYEVKGFNSPGSEGYTDYLVHDQQQKNQAE